MELLYIVLGIFLIFKLLSIFQRFFAPKKMARKEIITKVKNLIDSNGIFVASKSYCPYCRETLSTLDDLNVQPYVLQLNQISDGSDIQDALAEITGQSTVPNIFIDGKHIGGNSDLQSLKRSGELKKLLKL